MTTDIEREKLEELISKKCDRMYHEDAGFSILTCKTVAEFIKENLQEIVKTMGIELK